ncbi:MAG: hypothetical protein JO252_01845 [Planctomycetaceae bacterium]|nr:hypothetical protein [Planctomycetaceae bacterium]
MSPVTDPAIVLAGRGLPEMVTVPGLLVQFQYRGSAAPYFFADSPT